MKTILACLLIVVATSPSWGDVEVLNQPLSTGQVYTVPSGRVLLLEAGVASTEGSGSLSIRTPGASFSFAYSSNTSLPTSSTPRQPIYLKEGTTITGGGTGRSYVIFGRLATPNELYASTDPATEISLSADTATIVARADSKRPVRFELQESTDLESWTQAIVSSFTTTRDAITAEVAKSPAGRPKFVRAVPKVIPVDAGG
jgi:hypothetical protein